MSFSDIDAQVQRRSFTSDTYKTLDISVTVALIDTL